jgi:putative polyketide hydroxylase
MDGPEVAVEAITALLHAPLWRLLGERRYGIYPITHPDAAGVFVPARKGDRWVFALVRPPGSLRASEFDLPKMARVIGIAAGVPGLDPRIARVGTFAYTAQLADRFRDGNVFLAGDAAHRVTPRGGTGINTAIRDAYDLAWKLAWVLRGWADPALLDTYEPERRPVAEHNVVRSAEPDGSVREAADELHVDLGPRIPHVWTASGEDRRSTLDLLGPGLTLFTGPDGVGAGDRPPARAPVTVRRLPAHHRPGARGRTAGVAAGPPRRRARAGRRGGAERRGVSRTTRAATQPAQPAAISATAATARSTSSSPL